MAQVVSLLINASLTFNIVATRSLSYELVAGVQQDLVIARHLGELLRAHLNG